MGDVTGLLDRWNEGDADALKELIALVHDELRRMARGLLRHERGDHTLQPTALVNEAYLRLTGLREMRIDGRRHFYGAAGQAMRRVLVDYARQRAAEKRGGPAAERLPLDRALDVPIDLRLDFIRIDDALSELAALEPDKARVVELRFFVGLTIEETADVMGIAPVTVNRHWTFARAWLARALSDDSPS